MAHPSPFRKLLALALGVQAIALPLFALPSAAGAGPPLPAAASPFFHNYSAITGLSANASILDAARVARELNASFFNGGRGACWLDYDTDGDDDLVVIGPGATELFRNDGGWSFSDVTATSGLGGVGYGMGCAAADLNRDGLEDLWLTFYDSPQGVYRNNGNGTFTNVTAGTIPGDLLSHTGVSFGDFDNDGLLDVFVTNYNRQQDRIYRNLGNFSFEERWTSSRMFDLDFGFEALIYDYDLDGDVDVYVINDFGFDRLWQNQGNWTFDDVTSQVGGLDVRGGMGGDITDIDHDGSLELYVTNYQENGLWVQNGTRWEDRARAAGVDNASTGWAAVFFDYDNDGWDDLFVANGPVDSVSEKHQPNILYRNLGNGTFADVSAGSGADGLENSRSAAASDVDGDGRVDLYVTNVNAPNEMLRNVDNSSNGWLAIRLEGTVSNFDGVGAIVKVTAGALTQTKPMMAGAGYLGSHSKVMHFGLGAETSVDSVEVDWPSGLHQSVLLPALNSTVVIQESDPVYPTAAAADVASPQGIAFALNGSLSQDNVAIASFNWTVDVNGTPFLASGRVASMTIYTPGNFSGSLLVRDIFGNTDTVSFVVAIAPYSAAWVDAGLDFSLPTGVAHTFVMTGGSSITPDFENTSTFTWTFVEWGVPVTLSGPHPTYTFSTVGTWEVHVHVQDVANNTADDFVNVTVLDVTAPLISASVPPAVDEDLAASFDASATTDDDPAFPAGAIFVWSYPSASGPVLFIGANTTHLFPDPGLLQLTLTVQDARGNTASRAYALLVRDRTAPIAEGGGDRTTDPGVAVALDATGSSDNALDFFQNGSFTWRIHTRTATLVRTGVLQTITFAEPGTYLVELLVVDPGGNAAATADTFVIIVRDTVTPLPRGGGDRTVGVGQLVLFDASNSTDNDPEFLATATFVWEFQDGAALRQLDGITAAYAFQRAGQYRVRLSAIDASGNSAAILFTVTAADLTPPVLGVAAVPAQIDVGDTLALNASATTDNIGVASVNWRVTGPFAFDQPITGAVGSLAFSLPGTYNATVTAFDAAGNGATRSFEVRVTIKPNDGGNHTPPDGNQTPPGPEANPGGWLAPAAAILGGLAACALGALVLTRLRGRRQK